MHYWDSVLNEVLQKSNSRSFLLSHENFSTAGNGFFSDELENFGIQKEARDLRMYYLGDHFPNVYLTKREAESMFWLMQSNTIAEAAAKMALSARTVEFYVKNLKLKLKCKNKKMLIDKILQTSLLQQLEKEGMQLTTH
ncbi:MAG: LuxR C-terminal-related transcriptional regulator [Coxiellaceae bacterium]|nr:LuxR C-terminal-related transcriptional regulator [Coxiellaceae bacterium]